MLISGGFISHFARVMMCAAEGVSTLWHHFWVRLEGSDTLLFSLVGSYSLKLHLTAQSFVLVITRGFRHNWHLFYAKKRAPKPHCTRLLQHQTADYVHEWSIKQLRLTLITRLETKHETNANLKGNYSSVVFTVCFCCTQVSITALKNIKEP